MGKNVESEVEKIMSENNNAGTAKKRKKGLDGFPVKWILQKKERPWKVKDIFYNTRFDYSYFYC